MEIFEKTLTGGFACVNTFNAKLNGIRLQKNENRQELISIQK